MRLLEVLRATVGSHPGLRRSASGAVDVLLAASRTTPPGLRGAPAGVPEQDVSTLLVAVLGVDDATLASTLDDLGRAARLHGALRVVVAVEGRHLTAARRAGLAAERLPAADDLPPGGTARADRLRELLETARADYVAAAVLVLGSTGTTGTPPELIAAAVPRHRPVRWRRRLQGAVLRLEQLLDAPTG